MNVTAIICEYNPFTNGHLKHLQLAKEQTNADAVICIMSGSFTQRGDAAILSKYQRAELAVRLGADMVVELPHIFAISPADNFAFGAIKILASLPNVTHLSFGSECGNVNLLTKAAYFLYNEPQRYKELLKTYQSSGNSFPKARSLALQDFAKENPTYSDISEILDKPNNVLGIAYIQALKKFGLDNIAIHTIKRETEYSDLSLDGDFPSASAVRMAIVQGKIADIKNSVPPFCYNLLESVNLNGTSLGDLCLFKLKDISGYDLENYYDFTGGLHNRLKLAASEAITFEEFLEKAKTKNYTMARIKRLSLYALFDITKDMYNEICTLPAYVHILALNKERKDILKATHQSCPNTLNRYSDIDKVDKRLRPYIKMDFKAQGTLNIINRSQSYEKSMILI
ncbi:MAG: nucleotidyltransferase family protein [Clostridiales bacterium]|nr:nucleotidyltransferase family protein [Clostridiales bacterium]